MKKIFTFFLALVASVGTMQADIFNGTCGDNLTWSLNTQDSILTIEGSGEMTSNPWSDYKSYIKYASLPDGLTNIGQSAFNSCSVLTSVIIPNSVISIGQSAFYGCDGLTSVTIPNSVTSIGEYAFSGRNIAIVTIGSSVASIGHDAFGSQVLTSIVVSEDNQFFSSADGVLFDKNKTIIIQCPVGKMGLYTIPNTVTRIGNQAFSGCNGLTSVTIPNSVTSIGVMAFYGCDGLISVTIGNSVTSIGDRAFTGSKLTSITIPNSVISIGTQTFAYCESLTSVTLGNSVTSIGNNAFQSCYSLPSVTIPNSVTSIGGSAFQYCYSLTAVEIPSSVTSIGGAPFQECLNLTSITVATDNPNYISEDGVLFDKDKKMLIQYPLGNTRTSYRIPNTVTRIGEFAFFGCNSLTSVTIPSSVTSIGSYAFGNPWTSLICEAINPPILGYAALNVDKSIPLYVPAESINLYKAADQWRDFTNILALPEPEEVNCNIHYVDKDAAFVSSEQLTFNVPEAPAFDGFTFLRWEFVGGPMSDGLTIQAIYEADEPSSAPEVITNPTNPAQKLIRDGNVYILKGDKIYTLQGAEVK